VETTFLTHMTALRRAAFQAVREPEGAARRDLANVQFHHWVNFPRCVPGKMASPVRLILCRWARPAVPKDVAFSRRNRARNGSKTNLLLH